MFTELVMRNGTLVGVPECAAGTLLKQVCGYSITEGWIIKPAELVGLSQVSIGCGVMAAVAAEGNMNIGPMGFGE